MQVDFNALSFLLGLVSYSAILIVILLLSARHNDLALPLLASFFFSALLSVINAYCFILPQGGSDAVRFYFTAVEWSSQGLSSAVDNYTGPSAYFISWLFALVFSIFGESLLFAQSISLLFHCGTVYVSYLFCKDLFGAREAKVSAWIVAFFPQLMLHSALLLRESYVAFLVVLGMYLLYISTRNDFKPLAYIFSLLSFSLSSFFHGAMVVIAVAVAAGTLLLMGKIVLRSVSNSKISKSMFFLPVFTLGVLSITSFGSISLPKLGDLNQYFSADELVETVASRGASSRGGGAHPEWSLIKSDQDILLKLPVRVAYFLFSPFPWDVRSPQHMVGLIDTSIYLMTFYFIFIGRRKFSTVRGMGLVLFSMLAIVFVFSISVTNFGTAIRHRSKFSAVFIVLSMAGYKAYRERKSRRMHDVRAS